MVSTTLARAVQRDCWKQHQPHLRDKQLARLPRPRSRRIPRAEVRCLSAPNTDCRVPATLDRNRSSPGGRRRWKPIRRKSNVANAVLWSVLPGERPNGPQALESSHLNVVDGRAIHGLRAPRRQSSVQLLATAIGATALPFLNLVSV